MAVWLRPIRRSQPHRSTYRAARAAAGPMDNALRVRETGQMLKPGSSRERLAGTLKAAFAEGLLSEQTLSYRLGMLFGPRLIEIAVNGAPVGRCQLRPGDRLALGLQLLEID
jgi:hypothetical protein